MVELGTSTPTKYLRFARGEALHFVLFLLGLHFAVQLAYLVVTEDVAQRSIPLFEVLEVDLLALGDEGIDHIGLSSLAQLLLDERIDPAYAVAEDMLRIYRLATGWQLVDDRYIEVAIERHCKSARNGRSCHHKHMRRDAAFCPHFCSLYHTETVLLVDNHKTEAREIHIILEHGMRAHNYINLARGERRQQRPPILLLGAARKQFHTHRQPGQHATQRRKMLLGKYLGGCHHAGLVVVILCKQHGKQRHKGFSAAHIALNKPVHLHIASHIAPYLAHDAFLSAGELKRKIFGVKFVEYLANLRKIVAGILLLAVFGVVEDAQLYIEELFEFQTILGATQFVDVAREMYHAQSLAQWHQLIFLYDGGAQRFVHIQRQHGKQVRRQFGHRLRIEATALHAFGGIVIWLQTHFGQL